VTADLPPTVALTVAPPHRYAEALEALASTGVPPGRWVIVTGVPAGQPGPDVDSVQDVAMVLLAPEGQGGDAVNISHWWNRGLDWVDAAPRPLSGVKFPASPYQVLLIESDARLTLRTGAMFASPAEELADALRAARGSSRGAVMSCPDRFGTLDGSGQAWVKHQRRGAWPAVGDTGRTFPGVAMMLAGEQGLRFDPQFRWWFADDDLERQAREHGGTVIVGTVGVEHPPGALPTDEPRRSYCLEDQGRFVAKWGHPTVDWSAR
jgi:hypothetical protein